MHENVFYGLFFYLINFYFLNDFAVDKCPYEGFYCVLIVY